MDVRGKSSNGKRLIDANALLLKLKKSHDLFVDAWEGFSNLPEKDKARVDEISNCIADVFNAPTVDAVEVVRCLECKHHCWVQEPCHGKSVHYCKLPHMRGIEIFKEFFCYYGERKEGAD